MRSVGRSELHRLTPRVQGQSGERGSGCEEARRPGSAKVARCWGLGPISFMDLEEVSAFQVLRGTQRVVPVEVPWPSTWYLVTVQTC